MALIDTLLKPTRSLVVTFSANGTLTIDRLVQLPNKTFPPVGQRLNTTQVQLDSNQDSINFEFGLDGSPNDNTSALFVEMVSDWSDAPWDCDLVNVLGSDEQFPFGNGPLGMSASQKPSRPRVRLKKGIFANMDLESADGSVHAASEITLFGPRKTSVYQLVASTPTKVFSLWFPDGITGYVKFSPWPGMGGEQKFVSDDPASVSSQSPNLLQTVATSLDHATGALTAASAALKKHLNQK